MQAYARFTIIPVLPRIFFTTIPVRKHAEQSRGDHGHFGNECPHRSPVEIDGGEWRNQHRCHGTSQRGAVGYVMSWILGGRGSVFLSNSTYVYIYI